MNHHLVNPAGPPSFPTPGFRYQRQALPARAPWPIRQDLPNFQPPFQNCRGPLFPFAGQIPPGPRAFVGAVPVAEPPPPYHAQNNSNLNQNNNNDLNIEEAQVSTVSSSSDYFVPPKKRKLW